MALTKPPSPYFMLFLTDLVDNHMASMTSPELRCMMYLVVRTTAGVTSIPATPRPVTASSRDIAGTTGLSRTSVVQGMRGLVARGVIERIPSPPYVKAATWRIVRDGLATRRGH